MSNVYHSVLITLQDLVEGNQDIQLTKNIKFNIPIYQRLYVWKEDQVKRLLEDTFGAFKNNQDDEYYLGGVIVVKNVDRFDLIDGQQRFTTLWLLARHLNRALKPFLKDRMHFSIREHANDFFTNTAVVNDHDELKNIKEAEHSIEVFFQDKTEYLKAFSEYLYYKLKLVFTTVPENVDLNKLFETINSGGVQLQHHELLKAKMIEAIKDKKQQKIYSKLWDSCAFMDNYLENNLAVALNCTKTDIYKSLYSLNNKKTENFKNIDRVLDFISQKTQDDQQDKKSLQVILKKNQSQEQNQSVDEKEYKEHEVKVRSIVSFSMVLLHTLRIFLKQKELQDIKEVDEKKLLEVFTNNNDQYGIFKIKDEAVVKEFIQLLWKIRFAFDRYVIKWVTIKDGTDEVHMICKMTENKNKESPLLQRDEAELSKEFSLLQSMLYHTQEVRTHYWLTPLINFLINEEKNYEDFLRKLDNYLFFPKKIGDLRINTWDLLTSINIDKSNCDSVLKQFDLIDGNDYKQFSHYLFYKIEYILWIQGNKSNDFYFRAKNSVEHISPQTPNGDYKQENYVTKTYLHSFGNLALVSRERNSEFGNKPFEVKQLDFKTKKDDESNNLKMSMIYSKYKWGDDACRDHLQEIKQLVSRYMHCEVAHV